MFPFSLDDYCTIFILVLRFMDSAYFTSLSLQNGVNMWVGGMLSPNVFSIYIDSVLQQSQLLNVTWAALLQMNSAMRMFFSIIPLLSVRQMVQFFNSMPWHNAGYILLAKYH